MTSEIPHKKLNVGNRLVRVMFRVRVSHVTIVYAWLLDLRGFKEEEKKR